jgi:hypothetical protein
MLGLVPGITNNNVPLVAGDDQIIADLVADGGAGGALLANRQSA